MAELFRLLILTLLCAGPLALQVRGPGIQDVLSEFDRHLAPGYFTRVSPNSNADPKGEGPLVSLWEREVNGKKVKKVPELPVCLFLAFFGMPFGCVGLGVLFAAWKQRESSQLLLGEASRRTNAQITGKRQYTTKDAENKTKTHYLASYIFEGVRDDGMRCKVASGERHQAIAYWHTLTAGKEEPVLYVAANPGRCRLLKAAEADSADCGTVFLLPLFGLAFTFAGFLVGVVSSAQCAFQSSGLLGALLCVGIYFCCVCCCIVNIKDIIEDNIAKKGEVTELGYQTKAEHLSDISGIWLLESDLGSFEYSFSIIKAETAVDVQGRQQGNDDWDAACEGHFAGEEGNELVWDDPDESHFRLVFQGPDAFTGSVHTEAGAKLEFKGSKKTP